MKCNKIFMIGLLTVATLFGSETIKAQGGTLKTNSLEIAVVSNFNHIYSDRGTGADSDLSTWSPVVPAGFYAVGHLAKNGYERPTNSVIVVKGLVNNAVAYPVGYTLIWDDAGSGGDQDGAFWEPIPPAGYVAMGTVVTANYTQPPLDAVVCVKVDLVVKVAVADLIWNDAGSGADKDLSLWRMDTSIPLILSGSFCSRRSHSKPDYSVVAYAIKLD
jgi:hypothetical protein